MRKFTLGSVGIEVTWNCNQKCSYCYLACDKEANAPEKNIPLELFRRILDKIWKEGVRDVYFIGGEPTLHWQFPELVALVNEYAWERKGICTNGVGLTDEAVRLIAENFDYASVSVRGNAETTAAITKNPESFAETIQTLRRFTEAGLAIRIGIDLLPEHFEDIHEIVRLLEENGVRFTHMDLHRMIPVGSARRSDVATIENYRTLLRNMHDIASQKGYILNFEDCLPLCLFDESLRSHINMCKCGTSKVWVDPYGNVRRCACTSGSIGNLVMQDFSDIWSSDLMREFQSFDWVPEECKKCALFDECRGGCPSSRGVEFFDKDLFSEHFKAIPKSGEQPTL